MELKQSKPPEGKVGLISLGDAYILPQITKFREFLFGLGARDASLALSMTKMASGGKLMPQLKPGDASLALSIQFFGEHHLGVVRNNSLFFTHLSDFWGQEIQDLIQKPCGKRNDIFSFAFGNGPP